MKKLFLLTFALIAFGLAAAAPPPSTASPPGADRQEIRAAVQDANPVALQATTVRDLNPVSIITAEGGVGADSSLKTAQTQHRGQALQEHRQMPMGVYTRVEQPETDGSSAGAVCWSPVDDYESETLTAGANRVHPRK